MTLDLLNRLGTRTGDMHNPARATAVLTVLAGLKAMSFSVSFFFIFIFWCFFLEIFIPNHEYKEGTQSSFMGNSRSASQALRSQLPQREGSNDRGWGFRLPRGRGPGADTCTGNTRGWTRAPVPTLSLDLTRLLSKGSYFRC